jgi:hypothetical protein
VALGRKTGGRKAGTPNKRTVALTAALVERLEALNFCPVEALIRVGQAAEAAGELDLARAAFADVAPFVYPRKKAVEHGGGLGLEKLVQYSIVTGVPRAPGDPWLEPPAAPIARPPERVEAPPLPATPSVSRPTPPLLRSPIGVAIQRSSRHDAEFDYNPFSG